MWDQQSFYDITQNFLGGEGRLHRTWAGNLKLQGEPLFRVSRYFTEDNLISTSRLSFLLMSVFIQLPVHSVLI